MNNEPLSAGDYNAQMRIIAKNYDYLNANPQLRETSIGRVTQARLDTLQPSVNPSGPNMPLIRSVEDLLDR